jgi:hypothetical protein
MSKLVMLERRRLPANDQSPCKISKSRTGGARGKAGSDFNKTNPNFQTSREGSRLRQVEEDEKLTKLSAPFLEQVAAQR